MRSTLNRALAAGFLTLAVAAPAIGHDGHDHSGFGAGFAHPFNGFDHLLAMIAVGLLAARRGGAALFTLPAAFVAAMAAGAGLAIVGIAIPFAEHAVLASAIILPVGVVLARRAPTSAFALVCGVFALAHGWVHAAEAPLATQVHFIAGALAATGLLHAIGASVVAVLVWADPSRRIV